MRNYCWSRLLFLKNRLSSLQIVLLFNEVVDFGFSDALTLRKNTSIIANYYILEWVMEAGKITIFNGFHYLNNYKGL